MTLFDALAQTIDVGAGADLDEESVDLPRLAAQGLGVGEAHDRRTVLEGLTRLIDADDAINALVELEAVAHALFEILGCGTAQDQGAPPVDGAIREGLARDDPEAGDGKLVGVVAVDDEVG